MLIWVAETTLVAMVLAAAAICAGPWLRLPPTARHVLQPLVRAELAHEGGLAHRRDDGRPRPRDPGYRRRRRAHALVPRRPEAAASRRAGQDARGRRLAEHPGARVGPHPTPRPLGAPPGARRRP